MVAEAWLDVWMDMRGWMDSRLPTYPPTHLPAYVLTTNDKQKKKKRIQTATPGPRWNMSSSSTRNATPTKRLLTELQAYQSDPNDALLELGPADDDELMVWRAVMKGVDGTAYEGEPSSTRLGT